MSDRKCFTVWKIVFAVLVLLLLVDSAHAYVGPGAGLELVGYAMSLVAWVGVAFSALFLYPMYSLIRRLRGGKVAASVSACSVAGQSELSAVKS